MYELLGVLGSHAIKRDARVLLPVWDGVGGFAIRPFQRIK